MAEGRVISIHVAEGAGAEPVELEAATAEAGLGLVGDRYFRTTGSGTFSAADKPGQDLTLIEEEALDALLAEHGIALTPGEARRNVVTRGIRLNELVGKRFLVGDVECRGDRLCDPCSHLQKVTYPGVLRGLADRGGLRADVVSGGEIRVGDPVTVAPRQAG
jgi:MOSC domain-containing protein YiiM